MYHRPVEVAKNLGGSEHARRQGLTITHSVYIMYTARRGPVRWLVTEN